MYVWATRFLLWGHNVNPSAPHSPLKSLLFHVSALFFYSKNLDLLFLLISPNSNHLTLTLSNQREFEWVKKSPGSYGFQNNRPTQHWQIQSLSLVVLFFHDMEHETKKWKHIITCDLSVIVTNLCSCSLTVFSFVVYLIEFVVYYYISSVFLWTNIEGHFLCHLLTVCLRKRWWHSDKWHNNFE